MAFPTFACPGVVPAFSASSCCPALRLTLAPPCGLPASEPTFCAVVVPLDALFPVLRVLSRSLGLAAIQHPVLVRSKRPAACGTPPRGACSPPPGRPVRREPKIRENIVLFKKKIRYFFVERRKELRYYRRKIGFVGM